MKKLWLTYAWKDNETEQVDFVIQSLQEQGLDVGFDRARLIPGQRLWPQLDAAISDPAKCDAWAIYVTKHSLTSEACLEELAFALDRALQSRGSTFPVIGIFSEPIDRALIPSALATRLYVSMQDPSWAQRVAAGARKELPQVVIKDVPPFHLQEHRRNGQLILEVRPRAGRWAPFVFMVPIGERDFLVNVEHGPSGRVPEVCIIFGSCDFEVDGAYAGKRIENPIDIFNSAYVTLSSSPSEIVVGQWGGETWRIRRN
jgi:hypothetical protein